MFYLQLIGLCGNFNGNIDDDTVTSSGGNTKNIAQFAQGWKTPPTCDIFVNEDLLSCGLNADAIQATCDRLKQGKRFG